MLVMDDLDLIGIDYLWEIALRGSERIVGRAVNLLKQSYTNLGPRLRANQVGERKASLLKYMNFFTIKTNKYYFNLRNFYFTETQSLA